MEAVRESNLSHTVLKSLDLLECLANSEKPLTAPQIAKRCGVSRPTAYRLLATLQSRGYVTNKEHAYSLGTKILSLGRVILESMDLANEAYPYLRHLNQISGETTYVSILDDSEILYINKVESSQQIRTNCTIGTRNPLYCTSMGKSILAFLPDEERDALLNQVELRPFTEKTIVDKALLLEMLDMVRQHGYAVDDCEIEDNVNCLGAPIFNHMGYPFAAMSISGPSFRMSPEKIAEFIPHLLEATQRLAERFGYHARPQQNGNRHRKT
jgi:DNA-binding IclR family transcriptional regulator